MSKYRLVGFILFHLATTINSNFSTTAIVSLRLERSLQRIILKARFLHLHSWSWVLADILAWELLSEYLRILWLRDQTRFGVELSTSLRLQFHIHIFAIAAKISRMFAVPSFYTFRLDDLFRNGNRYALFKSISDFSDIKRINFEDGVIAFVLLELFCNL